MQRLGRYTLYAEIASGGMATVHFARLAGEAGFTRTVAVKRLHRHLAKDPEFASMFLDEARLAARIRHPNVAATLDVEEVDGTVMVVMEYVHGEPLSRLIHFVAGEVERIPFEIASSIMTNVLNGLHAAHEVKDRGGVSMELVHRDISPRNILVGNDGVARVIDFGVAKARGRLHETQDGKVKGTLGYMSPEQLRGDRIDRRTDIYAAGVVLWEMLTMVRLFASRSDALTLENSLQRRVEPPSAFAADVPPALDEVVMRALARNPADRFDTAKQMALALETAMPVATQAVVAEWVEAIAHDALDTRAVVLADIERSTTRMDPVPRGRSSRAMVIAALMAAGLALATFAAIHFRRKPSVRVERESQTPANLVGVEPYTAPPSPSAPTSAEPTTSAPAKGRPPLPVSRRGGASRCDPPYTLGPDGIRHYKLECLP